MKEEPKRELEFEDRRASIEWQLKALFLAIEKSEDPDGLRYAMDLRNSIDRQIDLTAYSLYKTSGYSLAYIARCCGKTKQWLFQRLMKVKATFTPG